VIVNPSDLLEEPGCLHVDSHGSKHDSEIILEENGALHLNSPTRISAESHSNFLRFFLQETKFWLSKTIIFEQFKISMSSFSDFEKLEPQSTPHAINKKFKYFLS
jgi:hypothetical protein